MTPALSQYRWTDTAQEKAQAAREQILEAVPKAQIEVWSIDTSDNDSVRAFAEVRLSVVAHR